MDKSPAFPSEIDYCSVPLGDNPEEAKKLGEIFEKAIKFIDKNLGKGIGVLVHCNMGMSRSSSIIIAYLMHRNKWNFEKAYLYTRNIRKIILPNEGF